MSRTVAEIAAELVSTGLDQRQLTLLVELTAAIGRSSEFQTPRQERNRRYYEAHADEIRLKASERRLKRLKATETSESQDGHIEKKEYSEPKKVPRIRKTPLPADWQPTDKDRAVAEVLGWPDQRIESEIRRFKDHAAANGRLQKDWDAAWRNWVTSPLQQTGHRGGTSPRPGSSEDRAERTANAIRKLAEYSQAPANDPRGGGRAGPPVAGLLPFPKAQ